MAIKPLLDKAARLRDAAPFGASRSSAPGDWFRPAARGPGGAPVLEDPPERIVEGGLIRTGWFKTPVRRMNLLDSDLLGGRARSRLGLPRLIEWVGAGLAHPDWYFGFIIVDAKLLSLGVFYGFDRRTGGYFSHDFPGPPGRVGVAETTWSGATRLGGRGFEMEIRHRLEEGRHEARVDIPARRGRPAVRGELVWRENHEESPPLVLMSSLGPGGFIYNHKAQMPIEGALEVDGRKVEFDPRRDLANLDEVKLRVAPGRGYSWFNFGDFDKGGRVIGFNASVIRGGIERDPPENCIWSGERLSQVGPVVFEVPTDVARPWRARDAAGAVDLTFHPEGGKTVSLGPLGRYHQKCGVFRGTLVDGSGERHAVKDYYGCAENMDIL